MIDNCEKEKRKELNINDEQMIRYIGRVDNLNNELVFYNSNDSFEFVIYGTKVSAILRASKDCVKLRIYVDDDLLGSLIEVSSKEAIYTLASNLIIGRHVIRVVKANSENFGFIFLKGITGAEGYLPLPQIKRKKFEFYGDSLTAGYGVNSLVGDTWENEDSTKTIARLVSDYFNADLVSLCFSGVSIGIPYWYEWIVADRFERYAYTVDKQWDFTRWIPDVVFISLGTNDSEIVNENNQNEFVTKVKGMIDKLKKYYPKSAIVIYYGLTGTKEYVHNNYLKIINSFSKEDKVYYFNASNVHASGYNNHPNINDYQKAVGELIKYLKDNKIA